MEEPYIEITNIEDHPNLYLTNIEDHPNLYMNGGSTRLIERTETEGQRCRVKMKENKLYSREELN